MTNQEKRIRHAAKEHTFIWRYSNPKYRTPYAELNQFMKDQLAILGSKGDIG